MFHLGNKKPATSDKLTVLVHVIGSHPAFAMAHHIWQANVRTVQMDAGQGKEFLHFAYNQPKCTVWLQRDQGNQHSFEVIVRWEDEGTHEVYVIQNTQTPSGNDQRLQALLHSVQTVPSILPSAQGMGQQV
ncbi:MAG TPA: hypothetical protein VLF91_02400 [Candidatus Saccharimonadales bacterium]|nr:hypothetical protein [Candidatus Saccharimonadales bacterium]